MVFIAVANLLANISILFTYENFISLGLVLAVPMSAGKPVNYRSNIKIKSYIGYDVAMNNVTFTGMKLAGITIICCAFILVLTPYNLSSIIRSIIM